ncbi:MAG: hypothetical protein SF339_08600 [Blastocatellia bacterium]|nr:hypothetical protein [Blastocatellia bacterium]
MRALQDKLLNLAFQLANFIHRDIKTAKQITAFALESLETTTVSQDKRLYYLGHRTKVMFTELHLLQLLVYNKSAPFEQKREGDPVHPLSEERLLLHFIKHLVWITVRRNSLYVAVGLGRLLHRYTTVETAELYNIIIQDPARVPTDDYFRNRKKVLMDELLKRFGKLLATTRGAHGESRFASDDSPTRFAELVNNYLSAFTPWQTECYLPERFSPTDTALPEFSFSGADSDEEHQVEIKRYHALLHPKCFARLLDALGYAASVERLEIPRFCQASREDPDDKSPGDPAGAELNADERDEIHQYLRDRERRRKTASAQMLRFVANGEEVAQLDLKQTDQTRFQLSEYAEFFEIRSRDTGDDLLLATHWLAYDDHDQLQAQDAIIVLQNGRKLSFRITPAHATAVVTIDVAYDKTNIGNSLWLWMKQQIAAMALSNSLWRPALGFLLFAALSAGLGYLFFIKPTAPDRDIVHTASPTPTPQVSPTVRLSSSPTPQPTSLTSPTPRPPASPSLPGPLAEEVVASNIQLSEAGQPSDSLTRSERETAISLLEVRRVNLKISGGTEPTRRIVSKHLRIQLPKSAPFNLTNDISAADIALKLEITPQRSKNANDRIALTVSIVDAEGRVIWPLTSQVIGRKYVGTAEKIAIKLSKEISDDLAKLRR